MGLLRRGDAEPPEMTAALQTASFPSPWPGGSPTRALALSVPAVSAAAQTIAGVISDFPLFVEDEDTRERYDTTSSSSTFPRQLDPWEPLQATLYKMATELLFHPICYLRVLRRDYNQNPDQVQVYPYESVQAPQQADETWSDYLSTPKVGTYEMAGERVSSLDVIPMRSHWDGLLIVGADAINAAKGWEDAAGRMSADVVPSGILTASGADLAPEKVEELLTTWETARQSRSTAYLSSTLSYEAQSFDADQLGLNDARNFAVAEIARLCGLPPASASINAPVSSSLTYKNVEAQRRDLVDVALRPYLGSIEGWLSRLVPRGKRVRFDVDQFLRADAKSLSEIAVVLKRAGLASTEELRTMLGLPDEVTGELEATPTPGVVTPGELTDEREQEVSQGAS